MSQEYRDYFGVCLQWDRDRFLLLFPYVKSIPTNQAGLLLVELGVVPLFAFYVIPKAHVAVTWVGIELLVS